MAQLFKIIARKLQLHPVCLVLVLLVLGVVGLSIFVHRTQTELLNQSAKRYLGNDIIVGQSLNHETEARDVQSANDVKRTARPVADLLPEQPVQEEAHSNFEQSVRSKEVHKIPTDASEEGWADLDALYERLVIVTAVSDNHAKEALGMITSAQQNMPNTRIYLYNLGLKVDMYKKLSDLCNVNIREFNFSKYPPHVKDLHTYSWKVIIMRETLKEFGVIFYGDSSVRFTGSLRTLFPYLHRHHGYMFHIHGFDPKLPQPIKHQYFFTHKDMFAELGVDRIEYYNSNRAAPHISAGRVLMVNTSVLWDKILNPLNECAMRRECIAPSGSKYGSHRFDASALAIIVYKNLKYEWTEKNNNVKEFDNIVKIVRQRGHAKPNICLQKKPRT